MQFLGKSLLTALGTGLALSAYAAEPWVSVPSTPTVEQRLVVNGGSLGAYASVTLQITHPDGFVARQAGAADANGKLRYEYPLGPYGSYSVKVFDAAGKLIGGGNLGHVR